MVVSNSRTGSTNKLCIEVIADIKDSIVTYSTDSLIANSKDVLQADAIVLGSSENFGYMSGAMKVFFENIYYDVIEKKEECHLELLSKPVQAIGAYNGIIKITNALGWKEAIEPLIVVGSVTDLHLEQARLFGSTLAAGLEIGAY